jgi:hypothetical protein
MKNALAGEVGVRAPDHHGNAGKEIGHGSEETDLKRREAEGLEDLRHPEADAVQPDHDAEIEEREQEHAWARQGIAERVIADVARHLRFTGERRLECVLFLLGEPGRLGRPIGKQL